MLEAKKMNSKREIPCIFYLYIHSKIKEKCRGGKIKEKEATDYLHEWRIPRVIRVAMIKELETMGLVEKIDRAYLRVNPCVIEIDNVTKIYELVGILSLDN